jgi:hypothetical protein
MSDPRERLTRLVELATQNAPEKRRMLATELCDLLLDWPANYTPQMREPFETLLEKTMRLIDGEARRALIARIADSESASLVFLSDYFFDAPGELRAAILARNAQNIDAAQHHAIDEALLIDAARATSRDAFADALSKALEISPETAARILRDGTAQALAVAAKGAHLSRAAFSTLALLADGAPGHMQARLSAYDSVPQDGAEGMLAFWRGRGAGAERQAA